VISEEKMEKALDYKVETDVEVARRRAYYEEMEKLEKTVISFEYESLRNQGKGAKDSEMLVKKSQEYQSHIKKVSQARKEWDEMKERRSTADTIIDVWRSQNADRRRGNV
jgi:hypothetical protein